MVSSNVLLPAAAASPAANYGHVHLHHLHAAHLLAQQQSQQQQQQSQQQHAHGCLWRGCGCSFDHVGMLGKHILEQHINCHPSNDPLSTTCQWENCPRGEKAFSTKMKLIMHVRAHTGEKPYACSVPGCSKKFSRMDILNKHLRSHASSNSFVCIIQGCGKIFADAPALEAHKQSHPTTKPHLCMVHGCGKRYTDLSGLTRHTETHHKELSIIKVNPKPARGILKVKRSSYFEPPRPFGGSDSNDSDMQSSEVDHEQDLSDYEDDSEASRTAPSPASSTKRRASFQTPIESSVPAPEATPEADSEMAMMTTPTDERQPATLAPWQPYSFATGGAIRQSKSHFDSLSGLDMDSERPYKQQRLRLSTSEPNLKSYASNDSPFDLLLFAAQGGQQGQQQQQHKLPSINSFLAFSGEPQGMDDVRYLPHLPHLPPIGRGAASSSSSSPPQLPSPTHSSTMDCNLTPPPTSSPSLHALPSLAQLGAMDSSSSSSSITLPPPFPTAAGNHTLFNSPLSPERVVHASQSAPLLSSIFGRPEAAPFPTSFSSHFLSGQAGSNPFAYEGEIRRRGF